MNRLKFRIWDIQNARFLKQVENSGLFYFPDKIAKVYMGTLKWEASEFHALGIDCALYNLSEFNVQQSTGLTDCNNKQCFEGDIIKVSNGMKTYAVVWDATMTGYHPFTHGEFSDFEIIGNIFENPDLADIK